MYDLKIRNGMIVDGLGTPKYKGDVGIRDGKLVAVGGAPEDAEREIDASGKVVCPGFIDTHTHYDIQFAWDRMLSVSPWHGVTTVVIGCCGFGVAPTRKKDRDYMLETLQYVEGMDVGYTRKGMGNWGFESYPEYLDWIEKVGTGINVASLVGHLAIRVFVMGEEAGTRREATEDEINQMRAIVREAIQAGAVGFSTSNSPAHTGVGGIPVPSRCTTIEELEALTGVMGELGRGTFHCNWGPELDSEGIERIARNAGVPICDPGIGPSPDGSREGALLEQIERMNAEGLTWRPQMGVLPNTFEVGLEHPFMFALDLPESLMKPAKPLYGLFTPIQELATVAERLEAYKTDEFRAQFLDQTNEPGWNERYWPNMVINYSPRKREYEGCRLAEVAEEVGKTAAELMLDLSIESDLEARFGAVARRPGLERRQLDLYMSDNVVVGKGDGGAHVRELCDARYPTNLLGPWVRDWGLPIERAVQLMTKNAAEIYGIEDRGLLQEGLAADVVVFDPDTISDGPLERVNDFPGGSRRLISRSEGIDYVIVNGTILREHNEYAVDENAPKLPGKVLRSFRKRSSTARSQAATGSG